jgi:hypothetical protein
LRYTSRTIDALLIQIKSPNPEIGAAGRFRAALCAQYAQYL